MAYNTSRSLYASSTRFLGPYYACRSIIHSSMNYLRDDARGTFSTMAKNSMFPWGLLARSVIYRLINCSPINKRLITGNSA